MTDRDDDDRAGGAGDLPSFEEYKASAHQIMLAVERLLGELERKGLHREALDTGVLAAAIRAMQRRGDPVATAAWLNAQAASLLDGRLGTEGEA